MRAGLKTSLESSRELAQSLADQHGRPFYVFERDGMIHSIQEGLDDKIPETAERFVRQFGLTLSDPSKLLTKTDQVFLAAVGDSMKIMAPHARIMATIEGGPGMAVVHFQVFWEAEIEAESKIAVSELEGVLLGLRFSLGFCVHKDYSPKIAVKT